MSNAIRRFRCGIAACLLATSFSASAISVQFDPPAQTVALGQQASVAIRVSDVLPAGLGAYDFDVGFDAGLLAFNRADDAFSLGFSIGLGAAPGAGFVTVSDFSLELVDDLLALQTNDFVLFTLLFDTLAPGTSALGISRLTFGDALGNPLLSDPVGSGEITIAATAVPEPGTASLAFVAWFAGAACRQWRSRSSD